MSMDNLDSGNNRGIGNLASLLSIIARGDTDEGSGSSDIAKLKNILKRMPIVSSGDLDVRTVVDDDSGEKGIAVIEGSSLSHPKGSKRPYLHIGASEFLDEVEFKLMDCFSYEDLFLDYSQVRKGPKKGMVDIKKDFKELFDMGYLARSMDVSDKDRKTKMKCSIKRSIDPRSMTDRELIMEINSLLKILVDTKTERKGPRLIRKKVRNYSIEDFSNDTGFERSRIQDLRSELKRKKNIIFQGPPGTGKTYIAERLAWNFIEGTEGKIGLVQFHPSYTYEDFVQGFRPVLRNKVLSYELQDGTFKKFCHEAENRPNDPFVMLIDEINRANLSRVFGELMHLLEYREKSITLEASGEKFSIPSNVFIIGTMNTADRSIAIVDYALRRRFTFINLYPDYGVLKDYLNEYGLPHRSLIEVLKDINGEINDPNYYLGISYFMHDGRRLGSDLKDIWKGEIEPYLDEYFYDTPEKARMYEFDTLIKGHLREWS